MNYRRGIELISGIEPVSDDRNRALHAIGSLGGGLLGAYLWPKHWFVGFLLGSSLGWNGATVAVGKDVF